MLPVRCFTCNKIIGRYDQVFQNFKQKFIDEKSIPYKEFFEEHNIQRYCCRKIFMTYIDIFTEQKLPTLSNVQVHYATEEKKILLAR